MEDTLNRGLFVFGNEIITLLGIYKIHWETYYKVHTKIISNSWKMIWFHHIDAFWRLQLLLQLLLLLIFPHIDILTPLQLKLLRNLHFDIHCDSRVHWIFKTVIQCRFPSCKIWTKSPAATAKNIFWPNIGSCSPAMAGNCCFRRIDAACIWSSVSISDRQIVG